jgi:ABC-type multidrug transport system ATPase subunit
MDTASQPEPLQPQAPLQGPLIAVRGLEKSFASNQVLSQVNFALYPGEIVGLLGFNGAGKTTLVKLLCGLLLPDQGEISLLGRPLGRESVRQHVAVMKEGQPSLYEFMSARQNLLYYAALLGIRQAAGAVAQVLELCGLGEKADKPLLYLSFGTKRRVGLALAYLKQARVFLLDDASTGLNMPSMAQMRSLLRQYARQGSTVLLTGHEMGFMESICDRVLVLHNSRIVVDSSLGQLVSRFNLVQTLEAWVDGDPGFGEVLESEGSLTRVRFGITEAARLSPERVHYLKLHEGLLEQLLQEVQSAESRANQVLG